MIVDDDAGMREVLSLSLSMEGYNILTAANGRDALKILKKCERPSIILLDMRMPVMDGKQFLEEFRKIESLNSIPVFAMSGDDEMDGLNGATSFLLKPFAFETLIELIHTQCVAS